jgi:hypothetical protein
LALAGPLAADEGAHDKGSTPPPAFEARFADGSLLKLTLREDRLTMLTATGKRTVTLADVQKIQFATRIPDELAKRIDAAVAQLGSAAFQEREQASKELLEIGVPAYGAVQAAARSPDVEVRRRAEALDAKLRELVPAELLDFRKQDVITTKASKVEGRIEGTALRVTTSMFGDQEAKLADLRDLYAPGYVDPERAALPDPGTLVGYARQFGKTLYFRVTGGATGSVWGTDVYTVDSSLAAAAVHAGVLKPGQAGVVKLQIVVPPPGFVGSTQNGVTTANWGPFPDGAFKFVK